MGERKERKGVTTRGMREAGGEQSEERKEGMSEGRTSKSKGGRKEWGRGLKPQAPAPASLPAFILKFNVSLFSGRREPPFAVLRLSIPLPISFSFSFSSSYPFPSRMSMKLWLWVFLASNFKQVNLEMKAIAAQTVFFIIIIFFFFIAAQTTPEPLSPRVSAENL